MISLRSICKVSSSVLVRRVPTKSFSSVERSFDHGFMQTAHSAAEKSCYRTIDFKISETASVFEAINRMAGHDIGCLAVTEGSDPKGKVIGVISERDYIKKVAIHGLSSKDIKVSAVCTYGVQNLVVAANDEPIDECMKKMIERDIRHLLIRDRDGDVMSMLSIKDLVKMVVVRHNIVVRKLTDFALGKSVFYSSD